MNNKEDFNGYELSRNWFNFCFDNPEQIKPIHTAIYFFAIEHCNRLGWKQKFGFPSQMVMEAIGVKNWRTYSKALHEVVDFGFIKMIEISKNQYSSNIIAIVKNTKAPTKALDKALSKHIQKQGTKQGQSIVSINKQETKNNKQETKNVYTEDVHNCFYQCLECFDEHLQPQNEKSKNLWLDTIEKLNRIDQIPFHKIVDIVRKTRNNSFWKSNFLSLPKLRKTNNDGIKYVIVFNEQNNTNQNGQDTRTPAQRFADLQRRKAERKKNQ
jgi:hypothetical protein